MSVTTSIGGDYTTTDIQNTDFTQGYTDVQLTDASISGGSATVTVQILNGSGNVAAQHAFSGYVSGELVYANDPATVKQWILNYFNDGDSITMTASVPVQPDQGVSQYSVVGKADYSGEVKASASGTFPVGGGGGGGCLVNCKQKGPQSRP